jgi:hypothetical protein
MDTAIKNYNIIYKHQKMLAKKLAALSLTVIAYVAAQEQTFLSKSRDFEIYQPRLKQEFHGEAPV